jgi:peptidyl-prolyl cis-trans isomerase B (cyclophilin B)
MKLLKIETSYGTAIADLFEKDSPETVAYFVKLVQDAFYDGLRFFQVQPSYFVKTGCPFNNGLGGNGYFFKSELGVKKIQMQAGVIAFTHARPNTSSTQFIISLDDEWAQHLNKSLPRIGIVRTESMGIIREIKKDDELLSLKIEDVEEGSANTEYRIPSYI